MNNHVLEVRQLGKSYRRYRREWHRVLAWIGIKRLLFEENWVLRNISFSLGKGEAVGIIGQNGAGKSTLLKLITGTTRPTEGTVRLSGLIAALLELGIGFVPDLTGRQNVYHAAGLMGFSRAEIDGVISQVEEFAEIGAYFDQPLRTYSSGMHVRVAFAAATAFRPEVLIIDEALSVGDARFQHKCFARIREFKALGTTLLFVSHDLAAVLAICDRAILLDKGRFIMEGTPQDVYDFYHAVVVEGGHPTSVQKRLLPSGRTQLTYGSREAEIESVCLIGETGKTTETVSVGEPVTLVLRARLTADVHRLNAAYVISDRLGNYIFGVNTHDLDGTQYYLKATETIEFCFSFLANFGPGTYSVATALLPMRLLTEGNYEWRGPATVFEVVNRSKNAFIGTNWLEQKISVKRIDSWPLNPEQEKSEQ